jgi:hypothetical protein
MNMGPKKEPRLMRGANTQREYFWNKTRKVNGVNYSQKKKIKIGEQTSLSVRNIYKQFRRH